MEMVCNRCKSTNVQVVADTTMEKRGCMMILVHILIGLFTCGIYWVIILLKGRSVKTKTKFVCMNCKNTWY